MKEEQQEKQSFCGLNSIKDREADGTQWLKKCQSCLKHKRKAVESKGTTSRCLKRVVCDPMVYIFFYGMPHASSLIIALPSSSLVFLWVSAQNEALIPGIILGVTTKRERERETEKLSLLSWSKRSNKNEEKTINCYPVLLPILYLYLLLFFLFSSRRSFLIWRWLEDWKRSSEVSQDIQTNF